MENVNKARVVEENNMTGSKNILVAPEQVIFEEGGCIKRRSHLEKCLFVFTILFVLVSIGLLAALIITWRSGDRRDVCLTEDCVKTAAMISDSLDYSVEPCDNFYDFACGNWRKKHIIPEDKTSYGIIDELFKTVDIALKNVLEKNIMSGEPEAVTKTKTLYASCMNTTAIESRGVQPLLTFLEKFGGWPVVTSGWRESEFNFVDAMSTIALYNSFKWDVLPVFSTVVKADTKQSTRYIIYINQPSFGMPGRDYYLKGRNDTMVKAYEDLAVKVAVVLGATQNDAAKQMKEMVDFEVNLANISVSLEKRRNLTALYNKMNISHLQSIYPQFKWLRYFQTIFQTKGVDIIINDSLSIINEVPEYFSSLFQLLSSTPTRILSNYIGWRITMSFLTDLTNELDNLNTDYKKIIFGTSVSVPRWQKCAEYTKNGLKMAAGRMFVDETFDKAAKDNIMVMIDNLRAVFKEQLESNTWMDEETRQVARKKVDAIGENVGYPDEILDNNYLNNLYNNYEYGNNYFENILKTEYELFKYSFQSTV
ncbi:neprilysin-4 [Patella vulgata]|uniref:neprilysin-4 n=1 Tax=Patella vulgata TaxID=6465 RepID=UPI00217F9DF9|nr:neprilysin-4 [Patella vulgata]